MPLTSALDEGRAVKEDSFVDEARTIADEILDPPLFIRRGAALLYQVTVNNRLNLAIDPKKPIRGQSAFQTDLCVFEKVDEETEIPRVVIEFKSRLTTHDVLTYSTKARKHKSVYPYLRYGLLIANEPRIPGRFFTHNEALDFCVAAKEFKAKRAHELLANLFRQEIESSRRLERIVFGEESVHVYREDVVFEGGGGKII